MSIVFCSIPALPDPGMGMLTRLEELDVENNEISQLPPTRELCEKCMQACHPHASLTCAEQASCVRAGTAPMMIPC